METNPVLFDVIYSEELYNFTPPPAIIVDEPWESLAPTEKVLLEKILAAIKHSLHSIHVKYQASLDLSGWIEKPKQVVYFGNPVKGIPNYEVVEANGTLIVTSERLCDLSENEEARKKLWQALKKQFLV